jgi:hypothetical protein
MVFNHPPPVSLTRVPRVVRLRRLTVIAEYPGTRVRLGMLGLGLGMLDLLSRR